MPNHDGLVNLFRQAEVIRINDEPLHLNLGGRLAVP
jgi:hypothetical protein